jgi:hypothetical protein
MHILANDGLDTVAIKAFTQAGHTVYTGKINPEELATFIALETGSRVEYSQVPTTGDIYVPENTETRIKLDVNEGLGWKEAVTEMISKARILNHGAN